MIVSYDPLLVALSIVIACAGAFAGLQLAHRVGFGPGPRRKAWLSGAAVALGCGIWSMHFVGMLAVSLPIAISYDILLTLVSALLGILFTGLGLYSASYGPLTARKLGLAGLLMGLGISTMHYVGMAAVRGNCVIAYTPSLVAASVLVGIAASSLAIWLAFRPQRPWHRLAAATVMGLAISGMHYTAMAAATFLPVEVLLDYAAPALSPYLLAIVVAVAAFLIFGFALLIALPELPATEAAEEEQAVAEEAQPAAEPLVRLPVQRNRTTLLLELDEIVSIQADAHYSRISDGKESYFCALSLAELEARLDPAVFLRVHRSHIVNLKHARAFERHKEQGLIRLGGADSPGVPVSRRNVPKLELALGMRS